MSKSKIRPSESVIAANVPLGDRVSFSPFLGLSFKHVKGEAVTNHVASQSVSKEEFVGRWKLDMGTFEENTVNDNHIHINWW